MQRRLRPKVIVPLVLVGLLAILAVIAGVGVIGGVGEVMTTDQQLPLPDAAVGGSSRTAEDAGGVAGEAQSDAGGGTADKLAAVPPAGPSAPHYLIRNGDLSLLIDRDSLNTTMDRIQTLTARMGGYVSASGAGTAPSYGSGAVFDEKGGAQQDVTPTYGWLTVRVPQARFDAAIEQFSALGEVQSVSTSSEDVTSQYVDLQARLRHARAVELRLLRFLKDTASIREMLAVQDRLDTVQLTIEQLEAQLKSLNETTTYGTLSISLSERGSPQAGQIDSSDSFLDVLRQSLTLLAQGARIVALALTAALPFLAVAAVIGAGIWYALRWLRRRRHGMQPPSAAA